MPKVTQQWLLGLILALHHPLQTCAGGVAAFVVIQLAVVVGPPEATRQDNSSSPAPFSQNRGWSLVKENSQLWMLFPGSGQKGKL